MKPILIPHFSGGGCHRIKRVDWFLGNNRIPIKKLARALARTIIGPREVVLVENVLYKAKFNAIII